MSASAAQILRQIDLQEPRIRAAFLEWVATMVDSASLRQIETLIASGDLRGIAAALSLDAASMSGLVESVRSAALAGGLFETRSIKAVALTFDMRHREAEAWLSRHAGRLVTDILADQRELIRSAVTISTDMGRNPRQTALDLIGRVDRATGRRTGGIVGLTRQQGEYVLNARRELQDLSANYFSRTRRDRRFDSIVRRAIDDGKPLSSADIDRITGRYADRLLAYRGEVIARTEALTGLNAGRDLVFREAIADGRLRPDDVRKVWKTAKDAKVRDSHAALEGAKVGMDEAFTTPSGAQMRYPGDTELGAGPGETVQCRCVADYAVDFLGRLQ
jgi:hypothetical protein